MKMECLVVSSTDLPLDLVRHIILPLAWDTHMEKRLKEWFMRKLTRYLTTRHPRYRRDKFDLLCIKECNICETQQRDRKHMQKDEADRLIMRLDPNTPENERTILNARSKLKHLHVIYWVQQAKQRRRQSYLWRHLV